MATPDAPLTLEAEKLPNAPTATNPFVIANRISLWLLFGACVGFAMAIAGFISDMFWMAVVGSCVVLAMALAWIVTASYALLVMARDAVSAILRIKSTRAGSKGREP